MTARVRAAALAVVLGTLLAGCGEETDGSDGSDEPRGGEVPMTARALGAVAAEHAGDPDRGTGTDEQDLGVGAELRYGVTGGDDGDLLAVGISTGADSEEIPTCGEDPDAADECAELDEGASLYWAEAAPEEDPGYVTVVQPKGDAHVLVLWAGDEILGDPREQDLRFPVDLLLEIARDPRVDVTTSQDAVEAGEQLAWWDEKG